jgi:hypothetical protein
VWCEAEAEGARWGGGVRCGGDAQVLLAGAGRRREPRSRRCGTERKGGRAGADAWVERKKVDHVFVSTSFLLGVEIKEIIVGKFTNLNVLCVVKIHMNNELTRLYICYHNCTLSKRCY